MIAVARFSSFSILVNFVAYYLDLFHLIYDNIISFHNYSYILGVAPTPVPTIADGTATTGYFDHANFGENSVCTM